MKSEVESDHFRQIRKITIPHISDVSDLLAPAEKIIMWSYDEDNKYQRVIPKYLREGMESSTLSGTLWKLRPGGRRRPRLPPDPFVLIYGRWLIHDAEQHTVTLTREGYRVLPAPPGTDEGSIRWLCVRQNELDFYIRERQSAAFNISRMFVSENGLCWVAGDDEDNQ